MPCSRRRRETYSADKLSAMLRRALTPAGFVFVLAFAACNSRQSTSAAPAASVATAPPAPVASAPAKAKPAAPKPNPCPPTPPGSVSDDDAPVFAGAGAPVELVPWLEARGISRASAIAWYARQYGDDIGHAEAVFAYLSCSPVTVGDAAEEALACETPLTYGWMQVRGLVLVVRKKRITPVLDVGVAMRALDWPDMRHLDLALAFEPGGRAVTLHERAPEGALLVEAPSVCRKREALLDACEEALAKGVEPPEACPFAIDGATGQRRLIRGTPIATPFGDGKAQLHGCDAARAELRRSVDEMKRTPGDPMAKEARDALAFIQRTCNALGRYVWKGDRFVRERTSAPAQSGASSL